MLDGIREFELAEEVWAQNLAAGVLPLLMADVADRIPSSERFRQPIPVCGCRQLATARIAFFSLGHFAETYANPSVLRLVANGLNWLSGRVAERRFAYDIFLSYSSHNSAEAEQLSATANGAGLRVFMAQRDLHAGDVWDETIREALVSSREMGLLVTPHSLTSLWVSTEWGAAWALQKRITPILLRCDVAQLPDRLRRLQAVDFHNHERFFVEVRMRG